MYVTILADAEQPIKGFANTLCARDSFKKVKKKHFNIQRIMHEIDEML